MFIPICPLNWCMSYESMTSTQPVNENVLVLIMIIERNRRNCAFHKHQWSSWLSGNPNHLCPKLSNQNGLVLKPETLPLTNPKPASALNSIDHTFAVAAAMAVALARPLWPSAKPPNYPIKIKKMVVGGGGDGVEEKKKTGFTHQKTPWRGGAWPSRAADEGIFHDLLPPKALLHRRSTQPSKENRETHLFWKHMYPRATASVARRAHGSLPQTHFWLIYTMAPSILIGLA